MFAAAFSRIIRTKPYIFFSFILLLKSYLVWLVIFDGRLSWTPIYTELPFILIIFCVIEWFASKRKLATYIVVNLALTTTFFTAIMYYKYYGVIVTYHALYQMNQVTAVKKSVITILDPYYLLIYIDIFILGFLFFRSKQALIWKKSASNKVKRSLISAFFIVFLVICLTNIIPNRVSMNEIVKAEGMGILNYEAYAIFKNDLENPILPNEITQESIYQLKEIQVPSDPKYWEATKGKNIIAIQMESLQSFLINLSVDGQEVMPILSDLVKESYYFPNFYQQVGSGNTSDAEFVVNTSLYIPPNGAASQVYGDKELPSLPKLLKTNGYTTATFHTNKVNFWNRDELYEALGFEYYYDKEFFGEEDLIFFGASDEVLYDKTIGKLIEMDQAGKPFYANILSMSAHNPYTIPEEKFHMTLPNRYEDTMIGDYILSQNYADYALGLFIDDLKEKGIWENSLIVLYADHLGLPMYMLNEDEHSLLKEILGYDYSYTDMINVPFLINSPDLTYGRVFEQIGGQVDILPTLANLAGISLKNQLHFGQDLFNQTSNLLPQRYYLPSGSFLSGNAMFIPGKGFEDGNHYPFNFIQGQDKKATEEEYNRALKLLNMSDSYVNQLPEK